MDKVYCTECGRQNVATDNYCTGCSTMLPKLNPNATLYTPPAPRPYFANDPDGTAYPPNSDANATLAFNPKPTQRDNEGFNSPSFPPYATPSDAASYTPNPPPSYQPPQSQPNQPYSAPQNTPYSTPANQPYSDPRNQAYNQPNYGSPMWTPAPPSYAPPAPYGAPPAGQQGVDSFGLASYAAYTPPTPTRQYDLAGRGERLGAAMIDGIGTVLLVLALAGIGGAMDSATGNHETFSNVFMLLGYVIVIGVQGYFLTTQGQSIGKKALGLRILKEDTGANGGFVTNVLMRTILPAIIGQLTCGLFSLIDVLFIFSDDQKCLHDKMAGTIVVKASN